MAAIRLSARAFSDLERIFDFLAESDPDRALETVRLIRDAVEVLGRHPMIGRRVEGGHRELVISQGRNTYVARYRWFSAEEIALVLAIRHAREAGYLDE